MDIFPCIDPEPFSGLPWCIRNVTENCIPTNRVVRLRSNQGTIDCFDVIGLNSFFVAREVFEEESLIYIHPSTGRSLSRAEIQEFEDIKNLFPDLDDSRKKILSVNKTIIASTYALQILNIIISKFRKERFLQKFLEYKAEGEKYFCHLFYEARVPDDSSFIPDTQYIDQYGSAYRFKCGEIIGYRGGDPPSYFGTHYKGIPEYGNFVGEDFVRSLFKKETIARISAKLERNQYEYVYGALVTFTIIFLISIFLNSKRVAKQTLYSFFSLAVFTFVSYLFDVMTHDVFYDQTLKMKGAFQNLIMLFLLASIGYNVATGINRYADRIQRYNNERFPLLYPPPMINGRAIQGGQKDFIQDVSNQISNQIIKYLESTSLLKLKNQG